MDDPVWKERYRVRAGVEGTLSQGVRAFGMRQSRCNCSPWEVAGLGSGLGLGTKCN